MIHLAARSYLDAFYAVVDAFVEGDDPATTFTAMGAVLLARALAHSDNPCAEVIGYITGLPMDFIVAVLRHADAMDLASSERYIDLLDALRLNPADYEDVANALHSVQEAFWMSQAVRDCDAVLELHRKGFLIGGQPQWWTDFENVPAR